MLLWLVLAVVIIFLVFGGGSESRSVAIGKRGEARVSAALRAHFSDTRYSLIDDIVLPDDLGETQIDHVLISRYGIFVIETKNYSGWIFGRAKDRTWTQTFRRKRFTFQNPLRQNYRHVKAVQHQLGIPESWIHSVVLFVGSAKFKTAVPPNVTSLNGGLRYIRSFSRPVMRDAAVPRLRSALLGQEYYPEDFFEENAVGLRLAADSGDTVIPHRIEPRVSEYRRRKPNRFGLYVFVGTLVTVGLFLAMQSSIPNTPIAKAPQRATTQRSTLAKEKAEIIRLIEKKEVPSLIIPNIQLSGCVVSVKDGDTFTIKDGLGEKHMVRLHGIDAPDYRQAYWRKSRKMLRKLVYKKSVDIEVLDMDDDKRAVGMVYVEDTDVSLEMVCSGSAWWAEQTAPGAHEVKACQRQARVMALGLWADRDPVAPWDYRQR